MHKPEFVSGKPSHYCLMFVSKALILEQKHNTSLEGIGKYKSLLSYEEKIFVYTNLNFMMRELE